MVCNRNGEPIPTTRTGQVKNIQNYRKSYRDIPYIAVIIDELADIMLSNEQRVIEEVTIKTTNHQELK